MKNLLMIIFCLVATSSYSQIKGLNALKTEDQKNAAAAQEAAKAEQEALFAERPTSPSADIASDKPNVPAKKEKMEAKIKRYESEGFKVAVVFYSSKIKTKAADPSGPTEGAKQKTLAGSLPSIKDQLKPLAESFVQIMNTEFDTDIFELVDLKNIPYREAKWGKVDDWASTKYKMYISYSATPEYNYPKYNNEYQANLVVNLAVTGMEYVNEKKGVKMKPAARGGNLGYYQSAEWKSENDPEFKNIDELAAVVNPPMGADLLAELQKVQEPRMEKFIAKQKK